MAKNKKSKQRTDWAYATVNATNGGITIHYDHEDGTIQVEGAEPGSLKTERSYERASGKTKVVASTPVDGRVTLDADESIMAYDRVIAIDTNERIIGGKRFAAALAYYVPNPPRSYEEHIPMNILSAFLIVGVAEGAKSEPIGWHITLSTMLRYESSKHGRLAVVVDSELGLHKSINARAIGYYRDHMLPAGSTLLYASADADKETLPGQMIRLCDTMATRALDAVAQIDIGQFESRIASDGNYEWAAPIPFTPE